MVCMGKYIIRRTHIAFARKENSPIEANIKFMIKNIVFAAILVALSFVSTAQEKATKELTAKILSDNRLDTIQARALRLLTGFAAGTSYGEIWIRDFNTFINGSLHIHPKEKVKDILLYFFRFQGKDGNIV